MPDLGKKHECLSCGAKFYDLGRAALVCPTCGRDQNQPEDPDKKPAEKRKKKAAKTTAKKSSKAAKKKSKAKAASPAEDASDEKKADS